MSLAVASVARICQKAEIMSRAEKKRALPNFSIQTLINAKKVYLFLVYSMEQLPADTRAAPSASAPNDTVMDIHASPKRPREQAQCNMVSQRATTIAPLWPENQSETTEMLSRAHVPAGGAGLRTPAAAGRSEVG